MLFVIEGVDRTGKSSLAERLLDVGGHGHTIHWEKPRAATAIDEYVAPLMNYEPGSGETIVCDRHYLGEMVWPHVFGRASLLSRADQECVELFLQDRGAVCVLATRNPYDLEIACEEEPCAGRAVEAQQMFETLTVSSRLTWWPYQHGDDSTKMVTYGRALEADATVRVGHAR